MNNIIDETIEYLDNLSGEIAHHLKKRLIEYNEEINKEKTITILTEKGYMLVEKHKTNNWLIVQEYENNELTCARSINENEFLDLYKTFVNAMEGNYEY